MLYCVEQLSKSPDPDHKQKQLQELFKLYNRG